MTLRFDICEIKSNLNGRSIAVQHTELLWGWTFESSSLLGSRAFIRALSRSFWIRYQDVALRSKGELMRTCWLRTALFAVATIVLSTPALPQASLSTAQLNGTVLDTGARAVAKAQVGLRSVDTNQSYTSTTSEDGSFVMPSLPPGRYDLTIAASGFAKYQQTGISLSVGQAATVKVTLKVASASEVITVTTEAPPSRPPAPKSARSSTRSRLPICPRSTEGSQTLPCSRRASQPAVPLWALRLPNSRSRRFRSAACGPSAMKSRSMAPIS